MIPEEYVTLPTAKLLRDAGFPKDGCSDIYQEPTGRRRNGPFGREDIYDYIPKPTQAQAMRWLREDMGLIVTPRYDWDIGWYYTFENPKYEVFKVCDYGRNNAFPTYETAAEAGIQAACKYLSEKGGEG